LTLVFKKYLDVEYKRIQTQTHRGIPLVNRDKITQVTKLRSTVLGSDTEALGNKEKSNMKRGQNFDPLIK